MPSDKCNVTVRLPHDVKRFLETEAQANGSSQNSEIVRSIRHRMRDIECQTFASKGDAEHAA